MRIAFLAAILALVLPGCAGNLGQAVPSSDRATGGVGGAMESGRGADLDAGMSSAGRALLEQGRAQRLAGDFGQASASLERALRIEPAQPALWLELGQLRFDEGDYAQAEQMARKALSLAPEASRARAEASRLIEDAQLARGG